MGFLNFISDNWYLVGGCIILTILYYYKNKKSELTSLNKNDIELFMEVIIFTLIIITLQDKFFHDHIYFIISFFIFIPIWSFFIIHILNKGNIIMIESTHQGQIFYEMGLIPDESGIKEIISLSTGIKVHEMDLGFYESKEHYGNSMSPFQNVGDKVRHCDFFNGKMFYHPENPLLHNITFWSAQSEFLLMKDVHNDIMQTNFMLTELLDYEINFRMLEMVKEFPYALTGTSEQYKSKTFNLQQSLDEKMKEFLAEHNKNLKEKEAKTIKEGESDATK